jgi:hypothetical protein
LEYDELVAVTDSKQLEMKILTLFQKIDSLGNYTNIKWFLELDKKQLIRFARELMDIWNYRANLTYEVKREIVPQRSDPFYDRTINVNMLGQHSFIQIRKYCITIIDILINSGMNVNACSLGSYYVLCALTPTQNTYLYPSDWYVQSANSSTLGLGFLAVKIVQVTTTQFIYLTGRTSVTPNPVNAANNQVVQGYKLSATRIA